MLIHKLEMETSVAGFAIDYRNTPCSRVSIIVYLAYDENACVQFMLHQAVCCTVYWLCHTAYTLVKCLFWAVIALKYEIYDSDGVTILIVEWK